MAARYRNGWWLAVKYHEEGLTQREIADECDVSPRTIRKYMNEYGIETREVAGENHGLYGKERDEAVKEKISETLSGRELDESTRNRMSESRSGNTIPPAVRSKISESLEGIERPPETREQMSQSRRGEANPNWRGGRPYRYGPGWEPARKKIHERDEVCRQCGHDGSERVLDVHHIVPVRCFRETDCVPLEDAHQLDNLVLLCRSCHMDAEYGRIDFESDIEHPQSVEE